MFQEVKTTSPGHLRVAFYLRVSTSRQENEDTIQTQEKRLLDLARMNEWEVVHTYRDEAVSGTVPLHKRADGSRLMEDAERGKFDVLVCYRIDRIGRDRRVFWDAVDFFGKHNIGLKDSYGTLDTTHPDGQLRLALMIEFAQFERAMILMRTWDGLVANAQRGAFLGGPTPYGYRVVGHKPRFLEAVPPEDVIDGTCWSESEVVRYIYYLSGVKHWSACQIADHLNELGIPVPAYSGQSGQSRLKEWRGRPISPRWTDTCVASLLRKTLYKGVKQHFKCQKVRRETGAVTHQRTPERIVEHTCPALVDTAIWEAARGNALARTTWANRNAHRPYPLRGLVECGICGGGCIGRVNSGNHETRYYVCLCRCNPKRTERRCDGPYTPAEQIETDVWNTILWHIQHSSHTRVALESARGSRTSQREEGERELRSLMLKTEELQKRLSAVQEMRETGEYTRDEAKARIEKLRPELDTVRAHAQDTQAALHALDHQVEEFAAIEQHLEALQEEIARDMGPEERRRILELFVDRVIILPNDAPEYAHVRLKFTPIANCADGSTRRNRSYTLRLDLPFVVKEGDRRGEKIAA